MWQKRLFEKEKMKNDQSVTRERGISSAQCQIVHSESGTNEASVSLCPGSRRRGRALGHRDGCCKPLCDHRGIGSWSPGSWSPGSWSVGVASSLAYSYTM